jgi:hypothetical protein
MIAACLATAPSASSITPSVSLISPSIASHFSPEAFLPIDLNTEMQLKDESLSAYYASVPMKALALAQTDAAHGKLPADKQLAIRDTMTEIVDALADHADEAPEPKEREPTAARRTTLPRLADR